MNRLSVTLLLLAGCHHDYSKIPDQDRAVNIVWCETYHATSVAKAPPIEWIYPPNLTCHRGEGFYREAYEGGPLTSQCVTGVYTDPPFDYIKLSLWDGAKFSNTGLSHELYHAYLLYTTGDSDESHKTPGFQSGGIVDQADEALTAAGF